MAMFLKTEKVFDRIEWEFFIIVLEKLVMGPFFTQWIKRLYTTQLAKIQYIGCLSNSITIRRAVWQGFPLQPLLFNLVVEMLVLAVRQNLTIHGVTIGQDTLISKTT